MDRDIRTLEVHTAISDALHFTSNKNNSSFKLLDDFIIKKSLLILDNGFGVGDSHTAGLYKKLVKSLSFVK